MESYKQPMSEPIQSVMNESICTFDDYLRQLIPDNFCRTKLFNQLRLIIREESRERKLFIFQGIGNNGKTTLLDYIRSLLGNKCVTVSSEVLHDLCPLDMSCLVDKKLVIVDGIDAQEILDLSGRLKALLGDDPIICRKLYQQATTFRPDFDIIVCMNEAVPVTTSLMRRVEVVQFTTIFTDHPDPNQPHEKKKCILPGGSEQWTTVFKHILLNM
jgi:phage/plasmid-associated DNA primase